MPARADEESGVGSRGVGVKIFLALIVVGLAAAGIAGITTFFNVRQENTALEDRGVVTEADVVSSVRVERRARQGGPYWEISVAIDPAGPGVVEIVDLEECTEASFDPDSGTVEVVYLPDDPDVVRMVECRTTVDAWLPLVFGMIFLGLALLLIWRVDWR